MQGEAEYEGSHLTPPQVACIIRAYDTIRHRKDGATAVKRGRGKEMRGGSAATAIAVIARGGASAGMLTVSCREIALGQMGEATEDLVFFLRALQGERVFFGKGNFTKMNKKATLLRVVPLLLLFVLLLNACAPVPASWEDAIHTKDATVGDGAVAVTVKVTAEDKTVTLTLKTDAATLADALVAEELVKGEDSQFGLMISHVNGIRADYDLDNGYYWKIEVNGESSDFGASHIEITEGAVYEFIRTNQW